jgi:hypothetical protein
MMMIHLTPSDLASKNARPRQGSWETSLPIGLHRLLSAEYPSLIVQGEMKAVRG